MNNNILFLIILTLLLTAQPIQLSNILYSNYEYFPNVQLNSYLGYYGNSLVNRYSIPENAITAVWYFQVRALASCPIMPIYIYLQYGGYPVVTPINESFPSTNYNLNRVTQTVAILNVGGTGTSGGIQTSQVTISSPNTGYWYSSSFYLNTGDTVVSSCGYFLTSTTSVWLSNDTTVVYPNVPLFNTANGLSFKTFKYLTTSNYNDPIKFTLNFNSSSNSCSLTGLIRESALPITSSYQSNDANITCTSSTTNCFLSNSYPIQNTFYYLSVLSTCNYTVTLTVTSLALSAPIKTIRFLSPSTFYSKFYLTTNINNVLTISYLSVPYFIEYLFDQSNFGGTLGVYLNSAVQSSSGSLVGVKIYLNACLMFNTLFSYLNCPQGYSLTTQVYYGSYTYKNMSIPYPMIGKWYLALWMQCYDSVTNVSVSCSNIYTITSIIQVITDQCTLDYCGDYGTCNIANSQNNIYSSCQCNTGYIGYGCTESSSIFVLSGYVGKVLFLTMSNLLFMLPVLLALYRRWYIESLMYFYNMFFSTFYHACDQQFYSFCIFNYNGLQLADFISSYSSFIITILSMSEFPRLWKLFTYFLGVLLCLSVNLYNRFDTVAFIVLIVLSSVFTVSTWAKVWYKTRKIFPNKKRLLLYIPGLALGITGIVIYTSLQTTNNYWILHSFWHMLMATSILFFMPNREFDPLFEIKLNYLKRIFKKSTSISQSSQQTTASDLTEIPQASSVSLSSENVASVHRTILNITTEQSNLETRSINSIS
jgi:hypothetical protein